MVRYYRQLVRDGVSQLQAYIGDPSSTNFFSVASSKLSTKEMVARAVTVLLQVPFMQDRAMLVSFSGECELGLHLRCRG